MTWTCDQIELRLSDYLDGLLQDSERAEFESHADSCLNCAPLLSTVRSLVGELHSTHQVEEPARLVYAILDKTLGPRETVSVWQGFRNFLAGLATPKFAYGAASVFATFLILLGASGFSFSKPKLADLQPANVYRSADRSAHIAWAKSKKYVGDLRVVYEIQSRLRQDQDNLQAPPTDSLPKSAPEKNPGQTNDQKPSQPNQQNRADELKHHLELLADATVLSYRWSVR
jgi:anti-sigma factor RsiW